MPPFLVGHATHPDWRLALSLAAAQIDAARAAAPDSGTPTLGFAYFSEAYAAHAASLVDALHERWSGVQWVGAAAAGVAAGGVEYLGEPALVLMLAALRRKRFRLFSGMRPLAAPSSRAPVVARGASASAHAAPPGSAPAHAADGGNDEHGFEPCSALVHGDPTTADLPELVAELAERTRSGYLFGGLSSSRRAPRLLAGSMLEGGLAGVAFAGDVRLVSRVTQGCQAAGPRRRIDEADGNVVLKLDGSAALDCLLADLGVDPARLSQAIPRLRSTLAGLSDPVAPPERPGPFDADTRMRHLLGIDPARGGVVLAQAAEPGVHLTFCRRDVQAARRDLMRICAEIRDEVTPGVQYPGLSTATPADPAQRIAGAIYISCTGRGGPHFGAPSAELQLVQHALGDVPLAGFFAAGEIAHNHLYGYTGVLTVFLRD